MVCRSPLWPIDRHREIMPAGLQGRGHHMALDNRQAAALHAKPNVRQPAIAMAAHNPLAAKLAAAAGLDAIWVLHQAREIKPDLFD
jgi:hypothetical protein